MDQHFILAHAAARRDAPVSPNVRRHMPEPTAPKPFSKLKRADFEQAPVWKWLDETSDAESGDDTDESFVLQTGHSTVPKPEFGQFIVACEIDLKDGSTMPGIAEVTVAHGEVVVQPTQVFLLDRKLQIPALETNRLLARFTKQAQNYPIAWRLSVCIESETKERTGQIKGSDLGELVRSGLEALLALKAVKR